MLRVHNVEEPPRKTLGVSCPLHPQTQDLHAASTLPAGRAFVRGHQHPVTLTTDHVFQMCKRGPSRPQQGSHAGGHGEPLLITLSLCGPSESPWTSALHSQSENRAPRTSPAGSRHSRGGQLTPLSQAALAQATHFKAVRAQDQDSDVACPASQGVVVEPCLPACSGPPVLSNLLRISRSGGTTWVNRQGHSDPR